MCTGEGLHQSGLVQINWVTGSSSSVPTTVGLVTKVPWGDEMFFSDILDMLSAMKQEDEKLHHHSACTWHQQGPTDRIFNCWHWLMRLSG